MIKQVILPTLLKTDRHLLAMAKHSKQAKDDVDKRRMGFNEHVNSTEAELDEALNDGYVVISVVEVELDHYNGLHYLLHKPSPGESVHFEQDDGTIGEVQIKGGWIPPNANFKVP